MTDVAAAAVEYVAAGWRLVPIPAGSKQPRTPGWNTEAAAIATVERASALRGNVGLAHAWSGTCALDVDDWGLAAGWLGARGVDLEGLWNAPDAVRIVSGRPGRGKLLYRLPGGPLATQRVAAGGFELRCATAAGATVQDVLPPSTHPDTGRPYVWEGPGDWRNLPVIPNDLLALWTDLLGAPGDEEVPPMGLGRDEVLQILAGLDPSCGFHDWIAVGMALHHETSGEGFDLWRDWSAQSSKYPGEAKLLSHWRSFGRHAGRPITLRRFARVALTSDFEVLPLEGPLKERRPFDFVPAPDYVNRGRAEWIIKGVLPRAGLGVVYGDSGAGKTFAALDMVAHVAEGRDWRGCRTRSGRVAYICAEGAEFFALRLQAYMRSTGATLRDLFVCGDSPNLLRGRDDHKVIIDRVREIGGVSLIVIDTAARAMPGGNENASEDMGALIHRCDLIHRATGAMVLLIHHSGKDATRGARGHSSLRAACDAEFRVVKDPDTGQRWLEVGKQKDGREGDQYGFRLDPVMLGEDEDGDPIVSCVATPVALHFPTDPQQEVLK